MQRVLVVDSHTEGEPTRVVVAGAPDLGAGTAAERARAFRERCAGFRAALCGEPRGFDAVVGALLLPPSKAGTVAQVIFFNNVSTLHMCVHGTIGVAETLRHLGRLSGGRHRLETPVGEVGIELHDDGSIAVENVESYRHRRDVAVEVPGRGTVAGDVAWGGNWFFLVEGHGEDLAFSRIRELTDYAWDVRQGLETAGVTGADGAEIDHVELFGPPTRHDADSRNFVLCPGREYDRSPCGTGTSAKMACLFADGALGEGETWRQESILGTRFTGSVRRSARGVIPTVAGRAWITAEATLLLADDDPFREGIRR
ncbi:MAG TPA: proline racemase family protein [Thermoanaerobaculia bacterium]|nr:proline racemase family protein [Thermoanaerobaculia bacterium]